MVFIVRYIALLMLLPCLVWQSNSVAAAKPAANEVIDLDRVVAIVNDDVITESELNGAYQTIRQQLLKKKVKLPASEKIFKRQVLEQVILERVQLQRAAQRGITLSNPEIDRIIDNIAKRNKISRAKLFRTVLKEEGLDEKAFREKLRKKIIVQRLVEREVRARIRISDNEIKEYLENRNRILKKNQAYNLSHIFIQIPESASADIIKKAQEQARQIYAQLSIGSADFAQLAISYSRDKYALQGGLIGWRRPGQIPDLFRASLSKMKKGDISNIIRSANGFHILKLNDVRGLAAEAAVAVTQTRVRHILISPNAVLPDAEARKKAEQLRERIAQGGNFAALARIHSDDPLSATRGGNMGWNSPGKFLPKFERAMNALKPDEISQPVKTRFGYHIIQVQGRRTQNIGEERKRAKARKVLMARKTDTNLQLWLRSLRSEAFVKVIEID
jgi:peptidyl-prolyl cis-trans isomerase SurA